MMKGVTPRGGGQDIKFIIDDDSSRGSFQKVNMSGADGSMYSPPNNLGTSIDMHDNVGVSIMSMERRSFHGDDDSNENERSEMHNLDHSDVKIVTKPVSPQKKAAEADNDDSDDSSIIIKQS